MGIPLCAMCFPNVGFSMKSHGYSEISSQNPRGPGEANQEHPGDAASGRMSLDSRGTLGWWSGILGEMDRGVPCPGN